jgi:uncharacterized protein (DUF362 family)/NAD-dependent dihydropyrimidine dehydrogenase PreA subunit
LISPSLYQCWTAVEIEQVVEMILEHHKAILPIAQNALILLKPNLNSDMIGLTGNTTDLRIIASVVRGLQKRGYGNITVADGTSSGFLNADIDVMERLALRSMAERMSFHLVDLNRTSGQEIALSNGVRARVARICLDADFFINLPKLKTHAEAGLSIAMKNMVGCLVGLEKQKAHLDLHGNILALNHSLRPHLHIVDSIVAMEGTGPSMGIPAGLGVILVGEEALMVDLVGARMIGYRPDEVPYLKQALEQRGDSRQAKEIAEQAFSGESVTPFKRPRPSFLTGLINHPRYRSFFARLRYMPGLFQIFNSEAFGRLLFAIGGRQDMFIPQDAKIEQLEVDKERCDRCGVCDNVCPMHLHLPDAIDDPACIRCLYCYFACSREAIAFQGKVGHLRYQMAHYRKSIVATIQEGIK